MYLYMYLLIHCQQKKEILKLIDHDQLIRPCVWPIYLLGLKSNVQTQNRKKGRTPCEHIYQLFVGEKLDLEDCLKISKSQKIGLNFNF